MNTVKTEHLLGLDEDVLRSFVWSVYNFFTICTGSEPEIKTPYLFDSLAHEEYTGAIGVSGNHKGAIYLTLSKEILDKLLDEHFAKHSPEDIDEEEMQSFRMDYAGEIINIISGNARNYLGENFLISVPIVITAPDTPMHLSQKGCGIVFPITWKGIGCTLILNLSASEAEITPLLESFES